MLKHLHKERQRNVTRYVAVRGVKLYFGFCPQPVLSFAGLLPLKPHSSILKEH